MSSSALRRSLQDKILEQLNRRSTPPSSPNLQIASPSSPRVSATPRSSIDVAEKIARRSSSPAVRASSPGLSPRHSSVDISRSIGVGSETKRPSSPHLVSSARSPRSSPLTASSSRKDLSQSPLRREGSQKSVSNPQTYVSQLLSATHPALMKDWEEMKADEVAKEKEAERVRRESFTPDPFSHLDDLNSLIDLEAVEVTSEYTPSIMPSNNGQTMEFHQDILYTLRDRMNDSGRKSFAEAARLRVENEVLQVQLKEAKEQLAFTKLSLETANAQLKANSEQMQRLRIAKNEEGAQQHIHQSRAIAAQKELEFVSRELRDVKAERDEYRGKYSSLLDQNEMMKRKVSELEPVVPQYTKLKSEHARYVRVEETIRKSLDRTTIQLERVRAARDSEKRSYSQTIQMLQKEVSMLTQQLQRTSFASHEKAALVGQSNTLEKELRELAEYHEQTVTAQNEEIRKLRLRVASFERKSTSSRNEYSDRARDHNERHRTDDYEEQSLTLSDQDDEIDRDSYDDDREDERSNHQSNGYGQLQHRPASASRSPAASSLSAIQQFMADTRADHSPSGASPVQRSRPPLPSGSAPGVRAFQRDIASSLGGDALGQSRVSFDNGNDTSLSSVEMNDSYGAVETPGVSALLQQLQRATGVSSRPTVTSSLNYGIGE